MVNGNRPIYARLSGGDLKSVTSKRTIDIWIWKQVYLNIIYYLVNGAFLIELHVVIFVHLYVHDLTLIALYHDADVFLHFCFLWLLYLYEKFVVCSYIMNA